MKNHSQSILLDQFPGFSWLAHVDQAYGLLDQHGLLRWHNEALGEFVRKVWGEDVQMNWLVEALAQQPLATNIWRKQTELGTSFVLPLRATSESTLEQITNWQIIPQSFPFLDAASGPFFLLSKKQSPLAEAEEKRALAPFVPLTFLRDVIGKLQGLLLLTIDMQGNYTYISDDYASRYGIDAQACIGTPSLAHIHPDDHTACIVAATEVFEHPERRVAIQLRKILPNKQFIVSEWEFVAIPDKEGNYTQALCIGVDKTELAKSQETYEKLVSLVTDSVFIINQAGFILYVSPSWTQNFGYAHEQMVGKHFSPFAHPEEADLLLERVKSEYYTPTGTAFTHRIKHQQGHWSWVESKVAISPDRKEFIFISRDITERRVMEEQLREKEMVLETAGRMGKIGGWFYNHLTGKTIWSKETFAIHEVDEDFEVNDDNLFSFYSERDKEKLYQAIVAALEEGKPYDLELPFISGKGTKKWVRVIGNPLKENGQLVKLEGVIQDLTEKHQVQEVLTKQKQLLNETQSLAKMGGWELDLSTNLTVWTEEVYRIHEVPIGFEHNKVNGIEFYHPDDRPLIIEAINQAICEQEPFDVEARLITAKQRQIWVRSIGEPVLQDGKVTHLKGLFQDITQQKETDLALSRQAALLRQTQHTAKTGGWTVDVLKGETTVTEEMYRIHEVPQDFVWGQEDGFDRFALEDRQKIKEAFATAIQAGTPFELECQLSIDDQRSKWVKIIGNPVRENGQVTLVHGITQDISVEREARKEIKKREEMLYKLTQNVPGVIYQFEISPTGEMSFPYISQGVKHPVTSIDSIMEEGRDIFQALHPDDADRFQAAIIQSQINLTNFQLEYRIYVDGEIRWQRATSSPERLEDGTTVWYGIFQDITEERATKQEIARMSHLLTTAQHLAQLGGFEVDLITRSFHASEGLFSTFGLPETKTDDFSSLTRLIHADDAPRLRESFRNTFQKQQTEFKGSFRIFSSLNQIVYVTLRSKIFYDEQNQPVRIVGSVQNVTEQKEAELARKMIEERLKHMTDNMQEVFWLRSPDNMGVVYISPAYERVFDRTCESLIENPETFYESIFSGDMEKIKTACAAYAETGLFDEEYRIVHQNGEMRWVWVRQTPIKDELGTIISHTGIASDITKRKEHEDRINMLQSVVEHGQDSVLITSTESIKQTENGPKIVYANRAFYEMTGYTPAEVIGQTPRILQGPKSNQEELTRIRKALENWETIEAELINYRKDGSEYWVNFILTPIADEKGWFTHWVSIQRDISRRKRGELETLRAKEAAERASKAKSEFLSHMSHEIRTPLNAVIGMTGLLAETQLNPEQNTYLRTIRQGGESLLSVINDILDYSKIESGQMELEVTPFDLIDPIEDTLDLLAEKAYQKGLELIYKTEGNLPPQVNADVTRLRQILVNLVGNAIKFTEYGQVVVTVSKHKEEGDKLTLLFSVQDTGEGIPEEKQYRLFKSFSQVDASTTRKHGGTGLGLAISQQLVQLQGGKIWVESTPEVGSTFYFTIQAGKVITTSSGADHVDLSHRTIWVIDDNPISLASQAQMLQQLGVKVQAFTAAKEALTLAQQMPNVDLAIIDHEMPEMDGIALGKAIQHSLTNLPLLLTSYHKYSPTYAQNDLFADVIHKPLRKKEYQAHILQILKQDRHNRPDAQITAQVEELDLSPFQILLVEDNKINQKVAKRMLEKFSSNVEIANNGQEALDFLGLRSFDLILMDMQMPIMDGITATKAIRRLTLAKPPLILAMTANASQEDRDNCFAVGMNDFIAKPIKLEYLREVLRRWLVTQAPIQVQ